MLCGVVEIGTQRAKQAALHRVARKLILRAGGCLRRGAEFDGIAACFREGSDGPSSPGVGAGIAQGVREHGDTAGGVNDRHGFLER